MPKRGLNIGECEIARIYKLTPKGSIEVIYFTVPRKATTFQEDIFPPTKEDVAVISAEDWLAGQNAEPRVVSLKDGYVEPERAAFKAPEKTNDEPAIERPPKGEKEVCC